MSFDCNRSAADNPVIPITARPRRKHMNFKLRMSRRQFLGTLGAASIAGLAPRLAFAAYPDKPILFICPWPAGGTADQTMRALCAAASKSLGQSIVVENKAGAAGMLGLKAMAS